MAELTNWLDHRRLEALALEGGASFVERELVEAEGRCESQSGERALITLILEAVRREFDLINLRPSTLFEHLWNLCWWYDCPQAARYHRAPEISLDWFEFEKQQRIDPRGQEGAPWDRSGPKLFQWMEEWLKDRELRGVKDVWLRSLWPPRQPLGTGLRRSIRRRDVAARLVALNSDGQLVGISWSDGRLQLVGTQTGKLEVEIEGVHGVKQMSFSTDGRFLFLLIEASSTIEIRDSSTLALCRALVDEDAGALTAMAPSPSSQFVAAGSEGGVAIIWNVDSAQPVSRIKSGEDDLDDIFDIAWSPDGQWLAWVHDRRLSVWNMADQKTALQFVTREGTRSITRSPWDWMTKGATPENGNGVSFLLGFENSNARVYWLKMGPNGPVISLETCLDGICGDGLLSFPDFIFATRQGSGVHIRSRHGCMIGFGDMEEPGRPLGRWLDHDDTVSSMATCSSGLLLATASGVGGVCLWTLAHLDSLRAPIPKHTLIAFNDVFWGVLLPDIVPALLTPGPDLDGQTHACDVRWCETRVIDFQSFCQPDRQWLPMCREAIPIADDRSAMGRSLEESRIADLIGFQPNAISTVNPRYVACHRHVSDVLVPPTVQVFCVENSDPPTASGWDSFQIEAAALQAAVASAASIAEDPGFGTQGVGVRTDEEINDERNNRRNDIRLKNTPLESLITVFADNSVSGECPFIPILRKLAQLASCHFNDREIAMTDLDWLAASATAKFLSQWVREQSGCGFDLEEIGTKYGWEEDYDLISAQIVHRGREVLLSYEHLANCYEIEWSSISLGESFDVNRTARENYEEWQERNDEGLRRASGLMNFLWRGPTIQQSVLEENPMPDDQPSPPMDYDVPF